MTLPVPMPKVAGVPRVHDESNTVPLAQMAPV